MKVNLTIGKKLKWTLVGLGTLLFGILLGSLVGWGPEANVGNVLAVIMFFVGCAVMVVMLVAAIMADFDL